MVSTTAREAVTVVEQQLRRQRHVTLTEAAALTGLAIEEASEALDVLLKRYVCRLQVSEHGDVIYNFGETLRRRGSLTLAERLQAMGTWLWNAFTLAYKAWITLTLVLYFVVFLVIAIALLLASSAQNSSDNRRRSSSIDLASLLNLFFAIFRWQAMTGTLDDGADGYGRARRSQPTPRALKAEKKHLIASVYDFVFGPPRPAPDPFHAEKTVAAYLRQHKGVLVTSELSALGGLTLPQAETFLTDCVIRYQGETKISEQAVLYVEFDTLLRSAGEGATSKVMYYWDEDEPGYALTGNDPTSNWIIGGMNSFNVLCAALVLQGNFAAALGHGPLITLVLGWMPLIFSVLFFTIPLGRLLCLQVLRRHQHFQRLRKQLFKAIFRQQGQAQTLADVQAMADANAYEDTWSRQEVEETMQELSLDMAGEMTVTETAQVQFAFPRIHRELDEVERLRRQRRVDTTLGKILIESDNIVASDDERVG
jgi:hypothetical protein